MPTASTLSWDVLVYFIKQNSKPIDPTLIHKCIYLYNFKHFLENSKPYFTYFSNTLRKTSCPYLHFTLFTSTFSLIISAPNLCFYIRLYLGHPYFKWLTLSLLLLPPRPSMLSSSPVSIGSGGQARLGIGFPAAATASSMLGGEASPGWLTAAAA